jgi:glutamate carboxypeptidase
MPLNDLERRLASHIDRLHDQLIEDLRLHVGLPTGGDNRSALDEARSRLCSRLAKLGAEVSMVAAGPRPSWLHDAPVEAEGPPTAVCSRVRGKSGPRILLSGHLDTVHDPSPASAFRTLVISADGTTATGPGCVDMKGGLVIAVAALEALEACGLSPAWSFIFNSDEETGSYWSEPALRAEARRHDVGLVVEPALPDGSLVTERPGSGQFMVEVRGRSAHVGRDFTSGVSAVTRLGEILVELSKLPDPPRGKILSVGPIEGGPATNVVPDRARAWGNVRFKDAAIAREFERELLAFATDPAAMPAVIVRTSLNRPAKPATPSVMSLAEHAASAAADLGQRLPFGRTGGVCDGNILQDEGLPVIDTLGVRGGGLHTPQEWIDLTSLVERCKLLAILIARLASGGPGHFTPRS